MGMLAKRICSKKPFCWYISPFTKKKTNRYTFFYRRILYCTSKMFLATLKHAFDNQERASTT